MVTGQERLRPHFDYVIDHLKFVSIFTLTSPQYSVLILYPQASVGRLFMLPRSYGAPRLISRWLNSSRCPRARLLYSLPAQDKPYYVTTPIFYPNAVPHIGHLHSVVIADIFARYARLVQPHRLVYFMTGTDEHGLKIQKAAKEKGMHPRAFCDRLSQHFRVKTSSFMQAEWTRLTHLYRI